MSRMNWIILALLLMIPVRQGWDGGRLTSQCRPTSADRERCQASLTDDISGCTPNGRSCLRRRSSIPHGVGANTAARTSRNLSGNIRMRPRPIARSGRQVKTYPRSWPTFYTAGNWDHDGPVPAGAEFRDRSRLRDLFLPGACCLWELIK